MELDCRPVGLGHSPFASAMGASSSPRSDEHSPKARPPARLPRPTRPLAPDMQARRDRTTCSLRLATTPRSHSSPARQHGQTAVGEMATGAELAAYCVRLEAVAPGGRAWAAWGPAVCAWDLAGPTWPMPAASRHPGLLFDDAFMRRLGRKLASLPRLRAIATLRNFPPDARAWLAAAGFEELHPLAASEPTGRDLSGGEGGDGEGGAGGGRGGGGGAGSNQHEHELACTWGPARVHVYVRPPPDPFGC